jgi:5'/3'-nucleotidase SurE
VTGVRYGIDTFGPQVWSGGKPALVVTGPNVGDNLWYKVPFSGTVGGAVFAAHDRKVPAIAFSAASDARRSFAAGPPSAEGLVYAALATKLTTALLAGGPPYLPPDVWLNVNFPKAEGACADPAAFKFVLSRINPRIPLITPDDVQQCGSRALPHEQEVFDRGGCLIPVSPGSALDKTTADPEDQAVVYQRLKSILTCLPK